MSCSLHSNKKLSENGDRLERGTAPFRYKYTFQNGTILEGRFVNRMLEGYGQITFTQGKVVTGQFSRGLLQGKAQTTLPNGHIFIGYYENSKQTTTKCTIKGNTFRGYKITDITSITTEA